MAGSAELGVAALKSGDFQGAVTHLTQAAREAPGDATVFAYLGTAQAQLGQWDSAVVSLTHAVRLSPQSAALRYNLGTALERSGNAQGARESYQHAVTLDPNHERAKQSLARLGTAPPAGDFGIPSTPAAPAPLSPASIWANQTPQAFRGSSSSASETTQQYTAPGAEVTQSYPAPGGMRPLGDWQPPAEPETGLAAGQTAPPPQRPADRPEMPDPRINVVTAPERELPRSVQLGNCYLAGMTMGLWWGLIGTFFAFVWGSMSVSASQLGKIIPTIGAIGAMYVALGVILYALCGLAAGSSDDAETMGGNFGAAIGVFQALCWAPFALGTILYLSVPTMVGCVWISRMMGKSLGARINEWHSSVFVVTSASGVTAMRGR